MNREYDRKADILLDQIERADAVCVGAAAGMSVATGYDMAYYSDKHFKKYFGEFEKSTDFRGALTDIITHTRPVKNAGHFWRPPSMQVWSFRTVLPMKICLNF